MALPRALHFDLSAPESAFVEAVILVGPLLAMALQWTMAGSLVFGLYHHFVAMGRDHVGAQGAGMWGGTFVITECSDRRRTR
jgi:uncharacterized membrane protein YdbT with pleckstrin-like domain